VVHAVVAEELGGYEAGGPVARSSKRFLPHFTMGKNMLAPKFPWLGPRRPTMRGIRGQVGTRIVTRDAAAADGDPGWT
jgi:hypothetical protein